MVQKVTALIKLGIDPEVRTTQNGHEKICISPISKTTARKIGLTTTPSIEISDSFWISTYSAEGNLYFLACVLQKTQNREDSFQTFCIHYMKAYFLHPLTNICVQLTDSRHPEMDGRSILLHYRHPRLNVSDQFFGLPTSIFERQG